MSKPFDSGRALVVGIGQYQELDPLGTAPINDAEDVTKLLLSPRHCGYQAKNVQTLLNGDASKAAIVAGLQKLAANAQPNDTVVVYFSGHGAQRLSGPDAGTYLCPPEFESARPQETGVEAEELTVLLQDIPAQRLLVLVDACHSGAAARFKGAYGDATKWGFGGPGLDALVQGKGRVIIAASAADEPSWILQRFRNSLFTHFLLQGLQGEVADKSDGLIRVLDLFSYLADKVRSVKDAQNPVLKTHTQDNFPIALRKGGRMKNGEDARGIEPPAASDREEIEELLVGLYPQGPLDSEIWSRAGGDVSKLRLGMAGRAAWHAAFRLLSQGGGGAGISTESLLKAALQDFGNNPELKRFCRDI